MKKLILFIFVLLFFPSLCFGDAALIGLLVNQESGGTCSSQTTIIEQNTTTAVSSNNTLGQSFEYSSEFDIYSVKFYTGSGASGTCDVRIGVSPDLSVTYLEEVAGVALPASSTIEIVFTTNHTIPADTLYYVLAAEQTGTLALERDSNVFADGQHYFSDNPDFDTTVYGTRDLKFQVVKCD